MRGWRVQVRLGLAFGSLVTILMGTCYIGLNRIDKIGRNFDAVLTSQREKLQLTRAALTYSNRNSRIVMEVFLEKDPKEVQGLLKKRMENSQRISDLIVALAGRCSTEDESRVLAGVKQLRVPYTQSYARAIQLLLQEHKRDAAVSVMLDETLPALFAYHSAWGELFQLQLDQVEQAATESKLHYMRTRRLVLALMLLAGIGAITISTFVTRNTAREVKARAHAEAALSRLNKELEDRVAQRTSELTEANQRLNVETEQHKLASSSLRHAEEEYRRIFEQAIVGIFQGTVDRYEDVNPAMAHMFGYDSPQEFLASEASVPKNTYVNISEYEQVTSQAERYGAVHNFEHQRYRKDGSKMWLVMHLRLVRNHDRQVRLEGMCGDVTERKLLESELLQAQKMEAIGRLAGGVAHDFNNALMVIHGYTELIQSSLPEELRPHADEVLKAARRATSLTRQLLAFSRKQITQPAVLDLNSVVEDIEKMLRRLIGEDVELNIVSGPGLNSIRADRAHIEQILMNLAVNARDAMPTGGTLTITTSNLALDEHLHEPPYACAGHYVLLTVSDTGCGMDRDTQMHIFEPFFTTKEVGKGTGLGLSTVYGIVKQSNGYIAVSSDLGRGTTFQIYLPQSEICGESEAQQAASLLVRGSETILLVEDDDSLRALAIHTLQRNGYFVLDAANAKDALEIAASHHGTIHLLLTDIVMPGLNGRELATRLLASRPDTRVLFMSGYTHDLIGHRVADPNFQLLEKPFSIDLLLTAVREVLDGKLANAAIAT